MVHRTPLTCSKGGVTLTGVNEAQHGEGAPAQVTNTPTTPQTETHIVEEQKQRGLQCC